MKRALAALIVIAASAAQAAAPRCATPEDEKLLKAAVLEQALAAAAQSCKLDGEFARFVTAYRDGMVSSDRALKAFFARRPGGEGYEGYKNRIAAELSAVSLHDPHFCVEARQIFAVALRHQKAPPPHLIPTGYEGCAEPASPSQIAAALRPVARPKALPPTRTAKAVIVPVPRPQTPPVATAALTKPARFSWRELPPDHPLAPQPAATQRLAQTITPHAGAPMVPAAYEDMRAAPPNADQPNAYQPGAEWVPHDSTAAERYRGRVHMVIDADGHRLLIIDPAE